MLNSSQLDIAHLTKRDEMDVKFSKRHLTTGGHPFIRKQHNFDDRNFKKNKENTRVVSDLLTNSSLNSNVNNLECKMLTEKFWFDKHNKSATDRVHDKSSTAENIKVSSMSW